MNKDQSGNHGTVYCTLELEGRDWTRTVGDRSSSLSLFRRAATAEERLVLGEAGIVFIPTQNSFPSSPSCIVFLSGHCVFCAGGMWPYSCHCLLTT